jgi:ABC-2 type transport system ATP-binding protein
MTAASTTPLPDLSGEPKSITGPEMALTIENLTKVYSNDFQALRGISLQVERGDFFALLGPNGAGKSTTIGIIFSLINKTSGTVNICGIDIDDDFPSAKKRIGIVPQEFNFNVFEKVKHIVATQGGYYGLPRALAEERAEKYLKILGMKRRLMIARALVHEPELLILDEPTAGVDIEMRRAMWDFLRELNEQGTTIILTTHYLEEAETLCRNIAIIDEGRIIHDGSMRELLRELHTETFVLDIKKPLPAVMDIPDYPTVRVDDHSLEVLVDKHQGLNAVFAELSRQGIEILSLRNKTNRLEEMFVSLLK